MFNPISNIEKKFLLENLKKRGLREDRREINQHREISIDKLEDNGQVAVRFGDTLVISQIFAKLVTPSKDRPSEGIIVFSVDSNSLRPMAEFTQSNEDLHELRNKINNLLEKTLRESRALDKNSLCLVPEKLVWKIVVDVNIINNDGNLYDACMLASLASWMTFRMPFLRKQGDKLPIPDNIEYINLCTLHVPLSVTFGLYDDNTKFLVDPSIKEEKTIEGILIVSANKFNEICYIHTYGEIKISKDTVSELLIEAKEKIVYLTKILKKFVEGQKVALNSEKMTTDEEEEEETGEDFRILQGRADGKAKHSKMNVYEIN